MLNTLNFFSLTQMAEAAYADFADPELSPKEALIDKDVDGKNQGFSPTQADLFLADWQIKSGGHRPNTDSGFSSTLFQDKHDPTRYVLAIRGTEPETLEDLASDIGDIATDGIAMKTKGKLKGSASKTKGVSFAFLSENPPCPVACALS